MLQRHTPSIDAPSMQRMLARVRAIALPLVFATAAGAGGITTLLPQPTHAADYAWCTQREGAVQCDFTTRAQCMQTASGTAYECIENPRLVARSLPQNAYGKLDHQRSNDFGPFAQPRRAREFRPGSVTPGGGT